MNKQQYEDYKYVMQDTYQIYLGSKYTFGEIVENEEIPFKFRLLVELLCLSGGGSFHYTGKSDLLSGAKGYGIPYLQAYKDEGKGQCPEGKENPKGQKMGVYHPDTSH